MPFQIVNHRYSLRGVYDYSWRESISFLSFLFINWDVCFIPWDDDADVMLFANSVNLK